MRQTHLIYKRLVGDDELCYVLAEAGNNHQGQVDLAHQLIDMAADGGAHGVKFQRRTNATLYSQALLDQPYDNPVSFGPTYGAHRAALELPLDAYHRLAVRAHRRGLGFVVTAFDEQALDDLRQVAVDAIKLPSGAATDEALVRAAVEATTALRVPLIVSTGGCREPDIVRLQGWAPSAIILHCTASYPCAFDELDLAYLKHLRVLFPDNVIGWSAHDNGIAMALIAWAWGARLIEKHITLNHTMKGTDHAFSLEREGLRRLCRDLARAPEAAGDGHKVYYESERGPIAKMRRRATPDGWRITGEHDA
jgi:N-acetylneuraminate synthase/sialic acid synthase